MNTIDQNSTHPFYALPLGFSSPVLDKAGAAKFVGFKDTKAFDKCVDMGIMPKPLQYIEHGINKHLWLIEDLFAALRKLSNSTSNEQSIQDQIRSRINARKN